VGHDDRAGPLRSARRDRGCGSAPRIAIEAVRPSVNEGRFPPNGWSAKWSSLRRSDCGRHDRLAAVLLWRAEDEPDWREAPMTPIGNDRWMGVSRSPGSADMCHRARLERSLRELCRGAGKEDAAGISIDLELEEGRLLIAGGAAQAEPSVAPPLAALAESSGRPIRRSAGACCSPRNCEPDRFGPYSSA